MSRIRIPSLLFVAVLISASALAGGVPELRANPTQVNGVYSLTFNLTLGSQLPAGTTITCRARIAPNQPGLDFRTQPQPALPIETTHCHR